MISATYLQCIFFVSWPQMSSNANGDWDLLDEFEVVNKEFAVAEDEVDDEGEDDDDDDVDAWTSVKSSGETDFADTAFEELFLKKDAGWYCLASLLLWLFEFELLKNWDVIRNEFRLLFIHDS